MTNNNDQSNPNASSIHNPAHLNFVKQWKSIESEMADKGISGDGLAIKALEIAANEASNHDFVNWKRVRSAVEHENNLVSQRFTWLITTQSALLAAFSSLYIQWWQIKKCSPVDCITTQTSTTDPNALNGWDYVYVPMYLIVFMGFVICVHIYLSLLGANDQIRSLTHWWYSDAYEERNKGNDEAARKLYQQRNAQHPRLHLRHDTEKDFSVKTRWSLITRPFRIEFIPIYFACIWAVLLLSVALPISIPELMKDIAKLLNESAPYIIGGMLCLGCGVFIGINTARKKSDKTL